MNTVELINRLNELGLILIPYSKSVWAIGNPRFTNIMMSFNPNTEPKDYCGSVSFKVINAKLFTGEQIKGASELVHDFLKTRVEDREVVLVGSE